MYSKGYVILCIRHSFTYHTNTLESLAILKSKLISLLFFKTVYKQLLFILVNKNVLRGGGG